MSEITAMFYRDVREMKRISYHSKRSGRSSRWIDGTTGKTRKELQQLNSEMKVYIMDKLLTRQEFYALDRDMQKQMMEHWRNTKTTTEIRKALELSAGGFYSLLKRLDLPTNINGKFGRGNEENRKAPEVQEVTDNKPEIVYPEIVNSETVSHEEIELIENFLDFTDQDTGEGIARRLNAVLGLVDDDGKYLMTISIKKVVKK